MKIPHSLEAELLERLGASSLACTSVGGGCIAHASRAEADGRSYFLKWGRGEVASTFPAEAAGLRAMRAASSPLLVPEVYAVDDETASLPGFLLMEWIEPARASPAHWERLGEGLAKLHAHLGQGYGFERDNFIGRLPQQNGWRDRWSEFFLTRRLEPQVRRARDLGRWKSSWTQLFDRLSGRLDRWIPAVPEASLLHGDLWSGNVLPASGGGVALVDPAAYFGHRETDLAMTELFGGFDGRFYAAYRAAWPVEPEYADRRDLYNLYHLINHLNHFGSGYAGSVDAILRRFG